MGNLMGKPWKFHGENPWIPMKTMKHVAGAKFHGFSGNISMPFHASMGQENCETIPHKSMGSMHGI